MIWEDNTYRVVLFGHRDFSGHRTLDEKLYPLLKDIIRTKNFIEIYIMIEFFHERVISKNVDDQVFQHTFICYNINERFQIIQKLIS